MGVGTQVINPEFIRPGFFAGWFFIKEEYIGFNPLGVE